MAFGHTLEMGFGKRLAQAREAAGMTQGVLAEEIGVSQSTVGKWETEERDPRGLQNIAEKAAAALSVTKVTKMWLLTGEGGGPQARPEMAAKPFPADIQRWPNADAQHRGPSDFGVLDIKRLATTIQFLEEWLVKIGRKGTPEKKANAIVLLYLWLAMQRSPSQEDVHQFLDKMLLDQI